MSLRRADPARAARRYDRGMPVTQWDGPLRWDGQWGAERSRPPAGRRAARARGHQPARAGARRDRASPSWLHVGWPAGLAQVALAAIGPLALLGSRRFPGPDGRGRRGGRARRPALRARRRCRPTSPSRSRSSLAVARGAVAWAVASVVVAWVAAHRARRRARAVWHPFRIALTTLALAACFGIGSFVQRAHARAPRRSGPRRSGAVRPPSSASACASPANCTT